MSDNLFSRSFLLSSWVKEYAAYCASGEDALLLTKLQHWAERANHKETSAEKAFIQTFFVDIFGYSAAGSQAKADGYNLFPQFPVVKAGQGGGTGEADLAIGWFGLADIPQTPQVLCEFKDDRSGLDVAQNRKGNDRSPVKQCADYLKFAAEEQTPYGNEKIQPIWGIVTDMNEFRLYWKARMPHQYERFVVIKNSTAAPCITPLIEDSERAREQRFLFRRLFHRGWLLSTSGDTPRQTPRWPWPGLPDVETLKKSGVANMTGIKGAALTRWANEQWQTAIDQKLSKLNARLIPRVNLAVSETGGEIVLHADGVVVLSVIETEKDAPLIAAQWRQVLRTTSITPSLTAQKTAGSSAGTAHHGKYGAPATHHRFGHEA